MKNLKKIILVIIIVTYFLISTSLAKTGNINAQAARLRKENNTSSNIITNIYKGEEVEILEESGDWYKVKYQNNTGYIKKEFVIEKNTNTNNQNKTNNVSENAVIQTNTVQNIVPQNITNQNVAESTNSQNTNISAQNTNTQNTITENSTQGYNNQSNENNSIVSVSTSSDLRIVPNLMSNKITVIEVGKQLTKVSEVKNWVQVTDGNVTGWIPKAKISTSDVSQISDEVPETPKETNSVNEVKNNTINTTNTDSTNSVANNVSNNTTVSNNQTQTSSNKTGKVNVETAKVREKADQSSKFTNLLEQAFGGD